MLKKPEFRQSRETQIIYELFCGIDQAGDGLATWRDICAATGKERDELRSAILTATKRMRRDHGLVIENDRDLGYRLRPDNSLVNSGQKALERARRTERIGLEKMNCCELQKLSADEKAAHLVTKSALELGLLVTRPRVRSNLTQMIARKHNELTEFELMEAIADRLGKK